MALVTFVAGDVLEAAQLNDSFAAVLKNPTVASVATSQGTTSTSYTDLATSGPTVTVTTGTKALVFLTATTTGANNTCFMSFAVSGATTISAADARSLAQIGPTPIRRSTSVVYLDNLVAGSNTFTSKYRSDDAGNTHTFANREIVVIPL
jgi:hypothetical protein